MVEKSLKAVGREVDVVDRSPIVSLADERATDATLAGAKASALAAAAVAGLPVLPGLVLTTSYQADVKSQSLQSDLGSLEVTQEAYRQAKELGQSLMVRSSSCGEDTATSSMAGQFESVADVDTFDDFVDAVGTVLESAETAMVDAPMAVLIQPMLSTSAGGVAFGADPVTGRADRIVVSSAEKPSTVVDGSSGTERFVLDRDGDLLDHARGDESSKALPKVELARIAALVRSAESHLGGVQDIEWAIDQDRTLLLLQSRPITTIVKGTPAGPVYGPGPIAETFPEPLSRLEEGLWMEPLRQGVDEALLLAGVERQTGSKATPSVISVDGAVAIDLELAEGGAKLGLLRRFGLRGGATRVRRAWRIGRLRTALPALADDLVDRVDRDLEAVPGFGALTNRQLLALLERSDAMLSSLHAHEILLGLLIEQDDQRLTSASVALRVLSEARRDGLSDDEILRSSPVVFALLAPKVGPEPTLPSRSETPLLVSTPSQPSSDAAILREALRLRARWVQELTARAAWQLGSRLCADGELESIDDVRNLSLRDLESVVLKLGSVVHYVVGGIVEPQNCGLPASFRLTERGLPVAVRTGRGESGGTGAGGGVGTGIVTHDESNPPEGSVLVTRTLRPGLGPLLTRLSGVVSETGSVLSHLAILAREAGVPVVVGYADALDQFGEGVEVNVNGDSGEVSILNEAGAEGPPLAESIKRGDVA
ncbi:MAG: pyruvate, phosphate dikinase [Acidobacteria bacterium]|nr:pyruvate, phosphate dikinase [Acidobacteriota bacterium]